MMEEIIKKAEILIDALPYIRNFYGKTFVIKYGGAAQTNSELKESFAKDVVIMNYIGIHTVIVHGGGPKISATMERMGKKPEFVNGQRVTDQETMDIVEMVLGGLINKEIVSLINRHGGKAVGLSGKDGGMIRAQKKMIKKPTPETGVEEIVDLGLVGEVTSSRSVGDRRSRQGRLYPCRCADRSRPEGRDAEHQCRFCRVGAIVCARGRETCSC